MSLPLPDKWVRKAVSEAIVPLTVNAISIPVYDSNTTSDDPDQYVLMTTQTNSEVQGNKCYDHWTSSILLDIVTRYSGGNIGSRAQADDIADACLSALEGLTLDSASGLIVFHQRFEMPNDITTKTGAENIFRKLIRVELEIHKV